MTERPKSDALALTDLANLHQVRREFAQEWLEGKTPRLEIWLERVQPDLRPLLLNDLIEEELDFEYRTTGSYPDDAAITAQHPQFVAQFKQTIAELRHYASTHITLQPELIADGQLIPFGGSDRFRIECELGKGGQGTTFKATDILFHQAVALKVSKVETDLGGERRHLSTNEARLLGLLRKLNLANIVTVHDFTFARNHAILVMGLVEGDQLAMLYKHDRPSPTEATRIVETLARSLSQVHDHTGIIHRDITPRNVILTSNGSPVLIDFGLARIRDSWSSRGPHAHDFPTAGTPGYMAPEQLTGDAELIDRRTDVFGLGAMLYFLGTGRAPGCLREGIYSVAAADIFDSTFDDELAHICFRAISVRPAKRYATAVDFADALAGWRSRSTGFVHAVSPPGSQQPGIAAQSPDLLATTATFALAALVSGIFFHITRDFPNNALLIALKAFASAGVLVSMVIVFMAASDRAARFLLKSPLATLVDRILGNLGNRLIGLTFIPHWHESFRATFFKLFTTHTRSWRFYSASAVATAIISLATVTAFFALSLPRRIYPDENLPLTSRQTIVYSLLLTIAGATVPARSATVFVAKGISRVDTRSAASIAAWLFFSTGYSLVCSYAAVIGAVGLAFGVTLASTIAVFFYYHLPPEALPHEYTFDRTIYWPCVLIAGFTGPITCMFASSWLWLHIGMWLASRVVTRMLRALGFAGKLLEYTRSVLHVACAVTLVVMLVMLTVYFYHILSVNHR